MLIVLPKDFFKFDDDSQEFYYCLCNLLHIFREGYHYIYTEAPRSIDDFLLSKTIDKADAFLLKNIGSASRFSSKILDIVPYYMRITSFHGLHTKYNICDDRIIDEKLEFFLDQKSVTPSSLLCENINDCEVYQKYFSLFVATHYNGLKICFENIHGGGQSTDNIFSRRNKSANMLCIKDCDALCPEQVREMQIIRDSTIAIIYYIHAHEIENTFTCKMINEIINTTEFKNLFTIIHESYNKKLNFHKYIDLKKGISKKNFRRMPTAYMKKFIDFLKDINIINDNDVACLQQECQECDNCELVSGFGRNMLKKLCTYINNQSLDHINALLQDIDFNSFFPDLLPHIIGCGVASAKIRFETH